MVFSWSLAVIVAASSASPDHGTNHRADIPRIDHESAFEEGLALIVAGLAQRVPTR
jgi:hypothetical protein